MKQIHPFKRSIGQPRQHVKRITHMEADILQPVCLHMLERADHAIDERFAADQAVIGVQFRLPCQMLASAEADLELQGAIVAKQRLGIERPVRYANPREQFLNKSGLPDAQLVPLPPSVKTANCRRIIHYPCG